MTRQVLAAVGVVMALVTGCGGDDDDASDEAQPYVDAMIAAATDEEPGELQFEEGQAECVAPRWVEVFDPARMEEAGITPEEFASSGDQPAGLDLTEEDGGALYDAMVECGVDLREQFLVALGEGGELSEEDQACLEEQVDDDFLRRALVVGLTQGEDALQADEEFTSEMLRIFSECPGALPDSLSHTATRPSPSAAGV